MQYATKIASLAVILVSLRYY